MTPIEAEEWCETLAATTFLMERATELHYFQLTRNTREWRCALQLDYGTEKFIDKYGRRVADIYASSYEATPMRAVTVAWDALMESAQERLDQMNAGPAPKAPSTPTSKEGISDLLKELGL